MNLNCPYYKNTTTVWPVDLDSKESSGCLNFLESYKLLENGALFSDDLMLVYLVSLKTANTLNSFFYHPDKWHCLSPYHINLCVSILIYNMKDFYIKMTKNYIFAMLLFIIEVSAYIIHVSNICKT